MVSVLQYAEGLTDRQATDAVRGRVDWKFTLGLALEDPGFDASVLSEFRTRLTEQAERPARTGRRSAVRSVERCQARRACQAGSP